MKFTGERFIPTEQGKIRLEHYHRYALAQQVVAGKEVLDVACGEGYGSSFMADAARSVVGVDISDEAVQYASSTYKKSNLKYLQGSATALDFTDASFDVVVSFETIEHLLEQDKMISEIKRVLRPDGILVISSPNRPIYSEESGEHNEFHVKELDFKEFDELLKLYFPVVHYLGQRMQMGSVIQPLGGANSSFRAFHDDGVNLQPNTGKLNDPVYFMAICGLDGTALPIIDASILYPDQIDLIKQYVGFAHWAKSLDIVIAERDKQLSSLNQALSDITKESARRADWASRLNTELEGERLKFKEITGSVSWLVTNPLWELERWLTAPGKQAKRYIRTGMTLAKRLYQWLPISHQVKADHRNMLAKYFPKMLLVSGSHSTTVPTLAAPRLITAMPLKSLSETDFVKTFKLPNTENPLVSVIIPVYGQIEYTLRCLASIAANLPLTTFEVIIVDDFSPDSSSEILRGLKGIRFFANSKNVGFIRSCNFGASVAMGDYLYFLNNDTEVTADWLDALFRTFHDFPGTGFVGSKLVYPDGRLQEAGGIIWQDGSAWNFGRFQNPGLPVYNYAREVDYCSGASIMVPKELFEKLGGFDEHYLPAYCEDSDLALKIRDGGLRVIYQPMSTIIHYEGITSGTDTSQGTKSYQIENSKKLFERWKNRLQLHQSPGVDADDAKDRRASRRVLVIDHCTPTPNQDAGSITVFNLLLLLREMDFQVTFIPEDNFLYMPEYTTALQRAGIEILYAPYVTTVEQHLKDCGNRYDLAFLFRPGVVERHLKAIRKLCPKAKVLFHTVDLHFLRMSREAELHSDKSMQITANTMKQRELAAIRAVDASIVHSTVELDLLRPLLPDSNIYLFPLIMDIKGTTEGFSKRRDIVFVGGYQHIPNIDAVQYFAKEIMPHLRRLLPEIRFFAVGSNPPTEIQALASEDVIITGFVEDLTALLNKIRVSVAPLRYGAGIKGKIGTAMAVGLPVVTTTLGAEGMSLSNGQNILVADGAEEFATAIAEIYVDEPLWNSISRNGLTFADNAWGAEAAWEILAAIIFDLGINVKRGVRPLTLCSQFMVTVR